MSFKNPQELSFDFEPPQVRKQAEEAKTPGVKVAPVEEIVDEGGAEPAQGPDESPSGTRSARRKGGKKKPSPIKTQPVPQDTMPPEEMPPASYDEQGQPLEEAPAPSPSGGGGIGFGNFRFSITEILLGVLGLTVLIGSIWAILKIL